jgi:putative DNA primase/helicase
LFLHCNDLPATTDDTLFSSDRVQIIDFNRHFDEAEQDHNLESEFKKPENASGILNWMLEGCRLYLCCGFHAPVSVQAATATYRSESDLIGSFVNECLEPKSGLSTLASAVYTKYQYWCEQFGYKKMSFKNFNRDMERHVESGHGKNGKLFKGAVIKPSDYSESQYEHQY